MNLQLLPEDDPFLRTVCKPVDFANPGFDPLELGAIILSTMKACNGVGLAAPQVGLPHRVFVIGLDGVELVCYNPTVLNEKGDEVQLVEGCLSYPDLFMKVKRKESIQVEFQDPTGEKQTLDLDDWLARCFLHELDHLNGIVFLDRVGRTTLDMARKKRQKQRRFAK